MRSGFALIAFLLCSLLPAPAQTINPADYGNITLRLKAEDLTYPANAAVTTWGSFTAGGTNTPTFIANDPRFNSKPVVKFDGTDDVMKWPTANLPARTIFAVVTLESAAVNLAGLLSTGADKLDIRRNNTTNFYRSVGQGMDANDFVGVAPIGNLYVNNVVSGSFTFGTPHIVMAVAGANQTYTSLWVGSPSASLSRNWNGSVAEIIIYDGVLTQTGIDRVGYYLQSKYNIPNGGYPAPTPQITAFTASVGGITASSGVLSTAGAPVTLAWNVGNTTSVSINNGALASSSSPTGAVAVSPTSTTTYTLTATNGAGTLTRSVTVFIDVVPQPLVFSEFLADNGSSILDEDGTSRDWIELYNPNPFAISAAGYALADGSTDWVFPDVVFEGNSYPIIFASGKNRTASAGRLHTNFKLSTAGEYLAFKLPGGAVATEFAPAYPPQRTDISAGVSGGVVVYYPTPTPGGPNGATVIGLVDDTSFSIRRGFYTSPQTVALSCVTPGAAIRYTTDNSTPTDTNGSVYSAPLTISSTRVLRARAFKPGYLPSNTDTQTYVFLNDVPGQVYAAGTAPAGWPIAGSAQLNGQTMRYGFNSALKVQYTAQQLLDGLTQVPSLSIVTDQRNLTDQLTGIYSNADQKGDAWERAASVEYLLPDNSTGFHINCGLRIRGGASRGDYAPKHSFRLYFRNQYGDSTLNFPLHGTTGTDQFQTIDIRSEENYSWANDTGTENTQVREVFSRDLAGAMGQPQTRSRYMHVYLNGQYWGLYMTEERPQEDYAASYFGGSSDDYDVVQTSNHPNFTYELASGTLNAWQQTWNMARACAVNPSNANYFALLGRDASGVRVPAMPVYIDPDHLAAYMLLHYYTGDGDGPLSNFLGLNEANNWRGFRDRLTDTGWRFFPHDCEHTLLAPSWLSTRVTGNSSTGTTPTNGSNRSNFTYSNAEWIHEDLATNAEYRLKIADAAQKYLFNNGALTSAKAQPLFDARAALISQAIVTDCVRWGTSTTNHTFAQWQARLANIRANFFPSRSAAVISQLQSRGFYPSATPPVFSQRGGQVNLGYNLTLSAGAQAGTIYYTLDGSDPRAIGGAPVGTAYGGAIAINAPVAVRTRFLNSGGIWSALDEAVFSTFPPAVAGKLVISKVHYHPANPTVAEKAAGYLNDSDFEFVELLNITSAPLDLNGVQLAGGVTFGFAGTAFGSLPAGGRTIVCANTAAFAVRYGAGQPVAGAFTGNLNNGGETLRLTDSTGATIVQFTYSPTAPWPVAADGGGPCLVLINPTTNPDPTNPSHWRPSIAAGGTPGSGDAVGYSTWSASNHVSDSAGTADDDADGLVSLFEYGFGTDPGQITAPPWTTSVQTVIVNSAPGSYLTISFTHPIGRDDLALTVEASNDLTQAWAPAILVGQPVNNGDGTESLTYRYPAPASSSSPQFLRIRGSRAP